MGEFVQPERTEHGGPVIPNDGHIVVVPKLRCRWGRKHRWIDSPRFPTYQMCVRCGIIRPRPLRGRHLR